MNMREFKFLKGYTEELSIIEIDWDMINRLNQITTIPVWTGTTYTPTWVVNPGLIQYTQPAYQGTYTIPHHPYGNTGTLPGYTLTTSNPSGITYTTGTATTSTNNAFTLTTCNTAFYNSSSK